MMGFCLRNTGNRKHWLQDKEQEVIGDSRLGDWVNDVAAETGNTGVGQCLRHESQEVHNEYSLRDLICQWRLSVKIFPPGVTKPGPGMDHSM